MCIRDSIDLCRDMWTYISMEYFKQRIKAGEIGSSAMPQMCIRDSCYVVSQAGTYMFPAELVDGTAIKGSFDTVDWTWRTTGVELSDIASVSYTHLAAIVRRGSPDWPSSR